MEYLIIVLLIIAQGVREYFTQKERSALLDRIMSRSYTEFKDNEKQETNQLEDVDDGFEDLDAVKETIQDGQEE